eukprot:m.185583 g.185583  ORF g.185583 m.185583 type:complete len:306 (-) comp15032_c0_seq1:151-1068(-)
MVPRVSREVGRSPTPAHPRHPPHPLFTVDPRGREQCRNCCVRPGLGCKLQRRVPFSVDHVEVGVGFDQQLQDIGVIPFRGGVRGGPLHVGLAHPRGSPVLNQQPHRRRRSAAGGDVESRLPRHPIRSVQLDPLLNQHRRERGLVKVCGVVQRGVPRWAQLRWVCPVLEQLDRRRCVPKPDCQVERGLVVVVPQCDVVLCRQQRRHRLSLSVVDGVPQQRTPRTKVPRPLGRPPSREWIVVDCVASGRHPRTRWEWPRLRERWIGGWGGSNGVWLGKGGSERHEPVRIRDYRPVVIAHCVDRASLL